MAVFAPAPLPSLSLLLAPAASISSGAPAYIPNVGLLLAGSPPGTIVALTGTFSISGNAAALAVGKKVTSAAGSFSITGSAATLVKVGAASIQWPTSLPALSSLLFTDPAHKFVYAAPGAFSLAGSSAQFVRGFGLYAAPGTFVTAGAPAERDLVVTAQTGAFVVSGSAAGTVRSRTPLAANKGTFSITGYPASLIKLPIGGFALAAQFGTFTFTGKAAGFGHGYRLVAATTSYSIQGQAVGLIRAGIPPVIEAPKPANLSGGGGGGKPSSREINQLQLFRNIEDMMKKGVSLRKAMRLAKDMPEEPVTKEEQLAAVQKEAEQLRKELADAKANHAAKIQSYEAVLKTLEEQL